MFRLTLLATIIVASPLLADAPRPLKILFLGDRGHHKPAERHRQLAAALAPRGIDIVYTEQTDAMKGETLARYDGLIVYANIDEITPAQEKGLLEFVASGKGFIPLHCASYCFRNAPKVVDLIGAQFQRHDTGTFRTIIASPAHPVMKGFKGFESWDETYTHTRHNEKNRTVLECRQEGERREPWTWVRTHEKGRVFYTAWGHDERTFGNPGFHNLVERGIRWACGQDPTVVPAFSDRVEMRPLAKDVKPFEFVEANVPFYPKSDRWGVSGENIKKMQRPLSAQESMKHITTPTEFELKLFVDETTLGGKPICMNWDERGRLWAALTYDYPNELQPAGQGRDRIVICEDIDGDGVCDKVTTFADKLSIPTSLLRYKDGVIVTQAPHTLFLRDTDGDGVCDKREVLFTGWGTQDTHAGPSNLRYGFDNWIYGMVGYSGFRGTVGGEQHRFSQGFFRFKPDGSKLEFLRSVSNNAWGVGVSEEGLLFGSTANGCPSVYMPIPNRYYEAVNGWSSSVLKNIAPDNHFEPITDKVRQVDWHGGFTAAAGSAIYAARNYPKDYWNQVQFVCEPTGHLVAMFKLTADGADFKAKYWGNLFASDDEWCAPIMAEVGPDGNVWVLDWYNYIVQHNPTPPGFQTGKGNAYVTDLRDRKHGRVYRVVPTDARPQPAIAARGLASATSEQLVAALKSDNLFWRLTAQRLLVERGNGAEVNPLLSPLPDAKDADDVGLNLGATHALWTMHGLGLIDPQASLATAPITTALRSKSAAVRRAAVMVAAGRDAMLPTILQSGVLNDSDPHTRLAAVIALAEMSASIDAAKALANVIADANSLNDRWLTDGLIAAAARHGQHFLPAIAARKQPLSPKALAIIGTVAEHFARSKESPNSLILALSQGDAKTAETVLTGLARGWPRNSRVALTEDADANLGRLLTQLSAGGKSQLLKLAATWGSKRFAAQAAEIANAMLASINNESRADADRAAAVRQLAEIAPPDAETAAKLLALITPQSAALLNEAIVEALSGSPATGRMIVQRLSGWSPSTRAAAVRALLGRIDTTRIVLDALENGELPIGELALDQRQALAAHTDKAIAAKAKAILARGGGLPNPDRQKVLEELLPVTKKSGDAEKGQVLYKNNCAKCHIHGNEGTAIGPNLSGVAVHSKEHILADILDPSRNVEGNFRVYRVEMKDGRSLSGLLASETKTSIELIDSEAKKHALQRADIDELQVSNKSLMPEGFEKTLKPDDFANLLAFLTKRGKYMPLPIDKAATVVTTRGMFFGEDGQVERLIFRDWTPKTFEGVPFMLVDPQNGRAANAIMLYGPQGTRAPTMPKSVKLPCNSPVKTIHFLSGVGGWSYPASARGSVSMIVRLHFVDGKTEDHELVNGEHFADYIRRVDVPGSKFAFSLNGRQLRYLAVTPKRTDEINEIELVKGPDPTAPVVMAVTVEPR